MKKKEIGIHSFPATEYYYLALTIEQHVVHFPCFKLTTLLPHQCIWMVYMPFILISANKWLQAKTKTMSIHFVCYEMRSITKINRREKNIYRYFVTNMVTTMSNDHSFSVCLCFSDSPRVNYLLLNFSFSADIGPWLSTNQTPA